MSESVSIKVHFDGKVFVPDEPVKVPIGTAAIVDIAASDTQKTGNESSVPLMLKARTAEERFVVLKDLIDRLAPLPDIPLEALRRENLYADDEPEL